MDRLLSIEAFVRVAETGNFAKAAQQLGVTRSVISHRIQQLEEYISAPLFHRSTRHVRLSDPAGLRESVHRDGYRAVACRGRDTRRQNQSGRIRHGLVH